MNNKGNQNGQFLGLSIRIQYSRDSAPHDFFLLLKFNVFFGPQIFPSNQEVIIYLTDNGKDLYREYVEKLLTEKILNPYIQLENKYSIKNSFYLGINIVFRMVFAMSLVNPFPLCESFSDLM